MDDSLDLLLKEGNRLFQAHDFSGAIACSDRIIGQDPDAIPAWILRGFSQQILGRHEDAIASFDRVLATNPDNISLLSSRAESCGKLGKTDEVNAILEQIAGIVPTTSSGWHEQGRVLEKLGRIAEAKEAYRQAIALDPKNAGAWEDRACLFFCLKEYNEALKVSMAAISHFPKKPSLWILKGNILSSLREFNDAITAYKEAARLTPGDPFALFLVAREYLFLAQTKAPGESEGVRLETFVQNYDKDYRHAADTYWKALKLRPESPGKWAEFGIAMFALGSYKDAADAYEKELAVTPDDFEALLFHGIALGRNGMNREALVFFDKALSVRPDEVNALYNKGVALALTGRFQQAIECFKASGERDPLGAMSWLFAGILYMKAGRYREAVQVFDRGIGITSSYDILWVLRDEALTSLGRYGSLTILDDKAGRDPEFAAKARYYRAHAFEIRQKYPDIVATYKKSLYITPEYSWRGELTKHALDHEDYRPQIPPEMLPSAYPKDPRAYIRKAEYLQKIYKYTEAVESYRDAVKLEPKNPLWRYLYGNALSHDGQNKKAIEAFDEALKYSPDKDLEGLIRRERDRVVEAYNNRSIFSRILGKD